MSAAVTPPVPHKPPAHREVFMNAPLILHVPNDTAELDCVTAQVKSFLTPHHPTPRTMNAVQLVLEEVLVNIISHGYEAEPGTRTIAIRMEITPPDLTIRFEDDARAFNPLAVPWPDRSRPPMERIEEGLGIYFVRRLKKTMEYRRENDRNILKVRIALQAPG